MHDMIVSIFDNRGDASSLGSSSNVNASIQSSILSLMCLECKTPFANKQRSLSLQGVEMIYEVRPKTIILL